MTIPFITVSSHKLNSSLISSKLIVGLLLLTPLLSLAAFWLGGERALIVEAVVLPALIGLFLLKTGFTPFETGPDLQKNSLDFASFETLTSVFMRDAREAGLKSAVFHVRVDDHKEIIDLHGRAAFDNVRQEMMARIRTALRAKDAVCEVDDATLAICFAPQKMMDLEICLELAGRLSRILAEPYHIDNTVVYLTVSLGFCQLGRETSLGTKDEGEPVNRCAADALATAVSNAPGAIRAYTPDTRAQVKRRAVENKSAVDALENGDIVPWFQPQISTDTGKITGFEALARWMTLSGDPISPAEFLPQLESAGMMERLFDVMLYQSLTAMKAWDQAGLEVQHVGVNFSPAELNDPGLIDKVRWELDRFELTADRLSVEILETVVAGGPEDVVTRNIKGLSSMGCKIDLDDFGTGHASLASIRRFGVARIKIDRSYVTRADRDADQRRMIRAILTMAEKLDLETLAEGVETVGEHSLLAQLGCTHVQGFGIGKPMPFEKTLAWINDHNAKLESPPDIGRATG